MDEKNCGEELNRSINCGGDENRNRPELHNRFLDPTTPKPHTRSVDEGTLLLEGFEFDAGILIEL